MDALRKYSDERLRKIKSGTDAIVPDIPGQKEINGKDAFSFDWLSKKINLEHNSSRTDIVIKNMTKDIPILSAILAANSLDEQISIIRKHVSQHTYGHLLTDIITIRYLYHRKDNRLKDALKLAKLECQLAIMIAEDLNIQQKMFLSPARYVAEALVHLGEIYIDLGQLSNALDHYHHAEEWFNRDITERTQRGFAMDNTTDRLFYQRDPRAQLFQIISGVYYKLNDETKAKEYARRGIEIDRFRFTTKSRVTILVASAAESASKGSFGEALERYDEALELSIADRFSQVSAGQIAEICLMIANILLDKHLFRQALRYSERALELDRRNGYNESMIDDYVCIGRICEARPDIGNCLNYYENALRCSSVISIENNNNRPFIWRDSNDNLFQVLNYYSSLLPALLIARFYAQKQDYDRANKFFELTINVGESIRSSVIQNDYRIGFQANLTDAYEDIIKMHAQLIMKLQLTNSTTKDYSYRAWEYAERARSRAFIDLLGTSPIYIPKEIPLDLRNQESNLIECLTSLQQINNNDNIELQHDRWNQYENIRKNLEEMWQRMISITSTALDYVELRKGSPLKMEEALELLT